VLPKFKAVTPVEYQQWCPVLLDWFCKSIGGISIAWKIQTVISAFTSALAGGLIISRALILIHSNGTINHEDTIADEILSYIFGVAGFYFQFTHRFSTPFPLNILLWPVGLAEYYIRWSINYQ